MRQLTPTFAVSAVASTHAVRYSIRQLLIAISAIACILGGFTMFGLFGASSVALLVSGLLVVHGRRSESSWITRSGIALFVPSISTLSLMMAAWLLFGIGPVYSAAALPYQFKKMAEVAHADIAGAKVSGLGGFLDAEHVWRLTLSSDQLDRVVTHYGLVPVPHENVPRDFWTRFPHWWRPSRSADSRFLSTPNFPAQSRGPDGDHCFAMYDSGSQRLFVWYKFNF